MAGGEDVLQRAVVQALRHRPPGALLGVERLRHEAPAGGRQLRDLVRRPPALDALGQHVGEALEEADVLLAETARMVGDGHQHPERGLGAADDHAGAAAQAQRQPDLGREPALPLPVVHHHRAAQAQRVARERRLARRQHAWEVGCRRRQAAEHQLTTGGVELEHGHEPDGQRVRRSARDLLDQLPDRRVA